MQGVEFLSVMEQMVGAKQLKAICREHSPKPRSQPKVSSEALIKSLIFHQLQPGGTLADHGAQLHGIKMSDSAAFAKLRLVSLVELGTHAPLAARVAPVSQSEQALANKLWGQIPEGSLLIGDRLFRTPHTLWQAMRAWQDRDVQALVRVRDNINAEILKRLSDGSALVAVRVEHEGRKVASLQLREIRAQGVAGSGKRFKLRLWTTLLDAQRYPAESLARHYTERWEHELYYRELKLDVRNAPILASHSVETAIQEVAAIVLASAILARLRVAAADELKLPASRMSFYKLMLATQQLWSTLQFMGGVLSKAQRRHVWEQYVETVRHTAVFPCAASAGQFMATQN